MTAAIAVILLAANFTITNAQQQLTGQPGEIENGTTTTTTFQSTKDSFRVQVPEGWIIQDVNNTGSTLLEEVRQGYGILAQLCPEEKQQPLSNISGGDTASCQGSEGDIIHVVRYPDLDTRLQVSNNVTTNNNMTTDNILSYHVQKLQEVGYRGIQIANSTETTVNLTIAQTNQTIATVPAKLVEITYSTNFASNEIRTGQFILTATNATAPNLGTTKGYAIFYEGSSVAAGEEETTTTASDSLLPPIPVRQVFDSFELIAAQEVAQAIAQEAQAAETAEGGGDGDEGDNGDGGDGDEGDNGDGGDGNGNGNGGDGDEGDNGDGGDGNGNGNGGDGDGGDGGAAMELLERIIEETQEN
jgi:hypothetical protein